MLAVHDWLPMLGPLLFAADSWPPDCWPPASATRPPPLTASRLCYWPPIAADVAGRVLLATTSAGVRIRHQARQLGARPKGLGAPRAHGGRRLSGARAAPVWSPRGAPLQRRSAALRRAPLERRAGEREKREREEPRIAPKLCAAMATNSRITSLLLADTNFRAPQAHQLGESFRRAARGRLRSLLGLYLGRVCSGGPASFASGSL